MPLFDVTTQFPRWQNKRKGKSLEVKWQISQLSRDHATVAELKAKYSHAQDKNFYMTANEENHIHLILGDSTYCKIRTDQVYKGRPEDPIVEETTFGWVIYAGKEYADNRCLFVKRPATMRNSILWTSTIWVEDRGEDDHLQIYSDFKENITRRENGRYEVSVPWISGSELSNTNGQPSRKRLVGIERKLNNNPKLKEEWENSERSVEKMRPPQTLGWFSTQVPNHIRQPSA